MPLPQPVPGHHRFPVSPPSRPGLDQAGAESALAGAAVGAVLGNRAVAELAAAAKHLGGAGNLCGKAASVARKAIRRVRAILALTGGTLGSDGDGIDGELRQVSAALAGLCRGQALVEAIDVLLPLHSHAQEQALLQRARRTARRRRDVETVAGETALAARERLMLLGPVVAALPWPALGSAVVFATLAASVARADTAGRLAIWHDKDADWHRWRRRARRVWQQVQALRGLQALDTQFVARRQATASHLGRARHAALLIAHCGGDSPFSARDRDALRALVAAGQQADRRAAADLLDRSPIP